MTIRQIIQKHKAISIPTLLSVSLEEISPKLTEVQRLQMKAGFRSTGKPIGKYRSPSYAKRKHEMNPLAGYGNKDLFLTGAFQGDIIVDVRPGSIVFSSADPKTFDIVEREGGDIFGLSKASIATQIRKPLAIEFAKQYKNGLRKL